MSILIWIFIHLYIFLNNLALLHYVMYTLTTGTGTHVTSFLPMPPAKKLGIEVRSFCTRHVYLSIQLQVFHLQSRCHTCQVLRFAHKGYGFTHKIKTMAVCEQTT